MAYTFVQYLGTVVRVSLVVVRVVVMLRVVVMVIATTVMVVVEKTNLKEPFLFNWCIALCQQIVGNLNNGEYGAGAMV